MSTKTYRAVCKTCTKNSSLTKFTSETEANTARKEHLADPRYKAHFVDIEIKVSSSK